MKEKNIGQAFIPQAIVRNPESKEDEAKYICPMHCEGEKTYDAPGRCPVCNMHLKADGENTDDQHHHHEQHIHGEASQSDDSGDYY